MILVGVDVGVGVNMSMNIVVVVVTFGVYKVMLLVGCGIGR